MRRQWPWLFVTVLVLQACSGTDVASVGRVSGVLNPVALLNGSEAGAGDDIPSGARLATDGRGVLEFDIDSILASCQLRPESQIVVRGTAGAAFEYVAGEMWCQAKAGPEEELTIEVGSRQLHVEDARFGLRDGEVLMDSGEADITEPDGDSKEIKAGEACDMQGVRPTCRDYVPTLGDRDRLAEVEASHGELVDESGSTSTTEPSSTTPTSETATSTTETEVTPTEPTEPTGATVTDTAPTETGG